MRLQLNDMLPRAPCFRSSAPVGLARDAAGGPCKSGVHLVSSEIDPLEIGATEDLIRDLDWSCHIMLRVPDRHFYQ